MGLPILHMGSLPSAVKILISCYYYSYRELQPLHTNTDDTSSTKRQDDALWCQLGGLHLFI